MARKLEELKYLSKVHPAADIHLTADAHTRDGSCADIHPNPAVGVKGVWGVLVIVLGQNPAGRSSSTRNADFIKIACKEGAWGPAVIRGAHPERVGVDDRSIAAAGIPRP